MRVNKIFALLMAAAIIVAIGMTHSSYDKSHLAPQPVTITTDNYKAKSIEYITGELKTNHDNLGLYKVTLQDGKEVLLYNDSKGIAMIQLK
jgi:hypothetical protein